VVNNPHLQAVERPFGRGTTPVVVASYYITKWDDPPSILLEVLDDFFRFLAVNQR